MKDFSQWLADVEAKRGARQVTEAVVTALVVVTVLVAIVVTLGGCALGVHGGAVVGQDKLSTSSSDTRDLPPAKAKLRSQETDRWCGSWCPL